MRIRLFPRTLVGTWDLGPEYWANRNNSQIGLLTTPVDYYCAARIISRILASDVSSAGVRPFRSSTVVSAPNSSSTWTVPVCFLKAAKWSGDCSLQLGVSIVAIEGAPRRERNASTWPLRAARETAVFSRKPLVFTSQPAAMRKSTTCACPASAALSPKSGSSQQGPSRQHMQLALGASSSG